MILLGINCGLGNADCGSLCQKHLDLDGGWLNYPRPKTRIKRRCPLWRETVEAIRITINARPMPKDDADADHAIGARPTVHPCTWCGGRLVHSKACDRLRESWIPQMTFGKHKDKRVDEVPRDYLEWLWGTRSIRDADVKAAVQKLLGVPDLPERHLEPAA